VLPKGLIEKGEKGWQTAVRETKEEMNVKARLLYKKPIHLEKYFFVANYKSKDDEEIKKLKNGEIEKSTRRVKKYQEEGGKKTKVFKTVSFYLAEYISGNPKDHGWEMEDGGWFDYKKALGLMAFKGEKEALKKAKKHLQNISKQFLFL